MAIPSKGVFVVGAHRSGTSATTRILNYLGFALGQPSHYALAPYESPDFTAYLESTSLERYNEHLLRLAKGAWWAPPPPYCIDILMHSAITQEGRDVFDQVHTAARWVWKDPRLCLLLPLWRSILGRTGPAVFVLRNPLEVSYSLALRDGISKSWGLAIWERYVRQAVQNMSGMPVLIALFEDVLGDPANWVKESTPFLAETAKMPILYDKSLFKIRGFLQSDLRHTVFTDEDLVQDPDVTQSQRDLYYTIKTLPKIHGSFSSPALPHETDTTVELFERLRLQDLTELPGATV